jgi:hypothetical protein
MNNGRLQNQLILGDIFKIDLAFLKEQPQHVPEFSALSKYAS